MFLQSQDSLLKNVPSCCLGKAKTTRCYTAFNVYIKVLMLEIATEPSTMLICSVGLLLLI